MRILIDMDGVTCDLLAVWLQALNQNRPTGTPKLIKRDITDWGMSAAVRQHGSVFHVLHREGLFEWLPAHEGAVEAISAIHRAGHEVRFATTAPGAEGAKGKIRWVERNFKHFQWGSKQVILAAEKHMLMGDILIDDKPDNIKAWIATGRDAIAPRHPYNSDILDSIGSTRLRVMGSSTDMATFWQNVSAHLTTRVADLS